MIRWLSEKGSIALRCLAERSSAALSRQLVPLSLSVEISLVIVIDQTLNFLDGHGRVGLILHDFAK